MDIIMTIWLGEYMVAYYKLDAEYPISYGIMVNYYRQTTLIDGHSLYSCYVYLFDCLLICLFISICSCS